MPNSSNDDPNFFNDLVAIKDSINKQIPLAANRFEEFECPPLGEHEHDIDIQFYVHESLHTLILLHYVGIDELREVYHTFINDHHLLPNAPLSTKDRQKMTEFLAAKTHVIHSKMERLWRLRDEFDEISFDAAKPKLLKIIQSMLPGVCDHGEAALIFDENKLIEIYLQELRDKIISLSKKIMCQQTLSSDELKLIDRHRRADVPHEEQINQLYHDLNLMKHFSKKKILIDDNVVSLFQKDALYNIDRLAAKLHTRKHTYAKRYEYNKKLSEIRETMESNLTTTYIDKFLKTVSPSTFDETTEKKTIEYLRNSQYLQTGLYYDLHQSDSGYCDEHACLGLVKLLKINAPLNHRVEKVSISYGDGDGHTFIVIDRAEISELDDMTTWGDKAILFDSWHQLVCYIHDMAKQGLQYRSFPKSATWSSVEFSNKDCSLLRQLSTMNECFTLTNNIDSKQREGRIIEEYGLIEFAPNSMVLSYLENVVTKYRPADFRYNLKFYTISSGDDLVKFIPGFREPTIAIHKDVILLLAHKKLSLTAFEFSIATILLQLQMYTSYVSPISISHESQQRIDIKAMEMIHSTEASIDYLRAAAEFHQRKSKPIVTVNTYERSVGGFNLKYVTQFNYVERIKVLQASIASGMAKAYIHDIAYPSPEFHDSLVEQGSIKDLAPNYIKILSDEPDLIVESDLVDDIDDVDQVNSIETVPDAVTIVETTEQKTIAENIEFNSVLVPSCKTPQTDCARRITILNQLIEQLPELTTELLPYELYHAPSVRLRQLAEIIQSLQIDYDNPLEADLVDKLINLANQMKVPGFEYIYYAFASRWGVSNIGRIHLECPTKLPDMLNRNTYYLLRNENDLWDLFYVDDDKLKHDIKITDVIDLEDCLNTTATAKKIDYSAKNKICFLLGQYQGLRQLGFFKSFQQKITAFTSSITFEEALNHATELGQLKQKLIDHLDDNNSWTRRETTKNDKENDKENANEHQTNSAPERLFGTDLGKRIKWNGFDLSSNESELTPYARFIEWAINDTSGIIAQTLFRLGLSNHSDVIMALTPQDLNYISISSSYLNYVFWGQLSGPHQKYCRITGFDNLSVWVEECKSKSHSINDALISDTTLSFEEAFIHYFDANLPGLKRPHLTFNANHAAQDRLLKEFYRIALSGSDSEKDVVRSFFFGREDKRDLKNLLTHNNYTSSLKFNSNYAQFICLQTYDGNQHQLFKDYDIHKLVELEIIYMQDNENYPITLEQYRTLFRLQEGLSPDNLLYLLLETCDEKKISLKDSIMIRYLKETKQVVIFSEVLNRIIATYQHDKLYFDTEIRQVINKAFWPSMEDTQLDHLSIDLLIKQYILFDKYTMFPSRAIKLQIGNIIMARIIALPTIEEQIAYYEEFLFSKEDRLPLSDVLLKNSLIDKLAAAYGQKYGKDDGSTQYYNSINPLISKLFKEVFNRDIKQFMSKLLTLIEAQKKLSDHVGMYADPGDYKLFSSKRFKSSRQALITLIKVADLFSKDTTNQNAFLNFMSSAFSQSSLNIMLQHVEEHIDVKELSRELGWSLYDYDENRKDDEAKSNEKISSLLTTLYYQFWDCSLHERAAIIEQVLIPASMTMSTELQTRAYEYGFSYISKKLFPRAYDTTTDDYLALCITESYLQTADNYLRSYLLAAMLVAANEHMGQEASIGKKLAIICEHMGPAYVKLAQAFHSKTTGELRDDLSHVKGKANPPHRWSSWRQIAEVLSAEDFNKIKRWGQLLGSASYNIALELTLVDGSTVVLLMLREDAELSARKGFAHIKATINACQHQAVVTQRVMMEQTIDEAARLSENEMSKEASEAQSQLAKTLYPKKMQLEANGNLVNITINTASILKSGTGYRFIEMLHGEEFNSLPDTTSDQRLIKYAVAKAVYTMELHNILRGGQFDSDRHGNQLRIQILRDSRKDNKMLHLKIGLYDFGEMALEPPTTDELQQLADVFSQAPMNLLKNKSMDEMISERINFAVKKGESTHYLIRLRKAFLAMQDFHQYLNKQDLVDILNVVASKQDIHPILKAPVKRFATLMSGMTSLYQTVSGVATLCSRFGMFSRNELPPTQQHVKVQNNDFNIL